MKYLLYIFMFFLISCANKVYVVKDDFYGNTYYQTGYITIQDWDTTVNLRLVGKGNNIIIEAQYISSSAFTVTANNKIVLKFDDNSLLSLDYIDNVKKLNKEEMYKTIKGLFTEDYYFDTYSVNAKQKVNSIGILTDIRLENSETFKNMKFPKNKAIELYNLFNEIKSYN